jgi:CubicO group peptidase (beta-lactamase class C family)
VSTVPHRVVVRRMVVVLTAMAAFAPLVPAAAAQSDPFAKITERMEQFVAEGQISGAVTLVGHQGRVVHLAAVGKADLERNTPMATDSLFRIASMTKPITATAVMVLVDEGKLSLDDPVEEYIPAFAHSKLRDGTPVEGLTIRRLLTHTSGLDEDQECEGSLEATAEMLAARPFNFQPGQRWQYSPGMNVCGRIIEVVSGQPYQDFLAERVLRPLRMSDTTFFPTPTQRRRSPVVYQLGARDHRLVPAGRLVVANADDTVASPSGGLYSTAADMSRFYQMILNGGQLDGHRIVSAEAVRAMTTVQTADLETGFTPGNGWGLGWCIIRRPQGITGMLSPGTFGHGGAFGTQGWVDPGRQAVFVLLIQRSDLTNSDASEIRREFQRLAVEALDQR